MNPADPAPRPCKVFCIGLSKTGTHSLTAALGLLGYDAVHWGVTKSAFKWTADGPVVDWALFERHDAFADTPIARIYPLLDARYPGARFILTLREPTHWLRSFADQFKGGGLDEFSARLHRELYGTDSFDPEGCRAAFLRHTEEVRAYFAGRPGDLLELDLSAGNGWQTLCRFLGRPVPAVPFPHRFTRAERRATWGYRLLAALRRMGWRQGPLDR